MGWGKKKIDVEQLLNLLQSDKRIQNEICSIVINRMSQKESHAADENSTDKNNQSINISATPSIERVATEPGFKPEQQMLDILLEDEELAKNWVKSDTPRDRQIVQLIVAASQWNNIQRLWKNIAKRCKERKASSTKSEIVFLQGCLDLHNLQWKESKVCFDKIIKGERYEHEKHQRSSITPIGEKIEGVWFHGLINVDGNINKKYKSIVITK